MGLHRQRWTPRDRCWHRKGYVIDICVAGEGCLFLNSLDEVLGIVAHTRRLKKD